MYCTNCGNRIENDANYCTGCGQPVRGTGGPAWQGDGWAKTAPFAEAPSTPTAPTGLAAKQSAHAGAGRPKKGLAAAAAASVAACALVATLIAVPALSSGTAVQGTASAEAPVAAAMADGAEQGTEDEATLQARSEMQEMEKAAKKAEAQERKSKKDAAKAKKDAAEAKKEAAREKRIAAAARAERRAAERSYSTTTGDWIRQLIIAGCERHLSYDEYCGMSVEQLCILRNGICAAGGASMKDSVLNRCLDRLGIYPGCTGDYRSSAADDNASNIHALEESIGSPYLGATANLPEWVVSTL